MLGYKAPRALVLIAAALCTLPCPAQAPPPQWVADAAYTPSPGADTEVCIAPPRSSAHAQEAQVQIACLHPQDARVLLLLRRTAHFAPHTPQCWRLALAPLLAPLGVPARLRIEVQVHGRTVLAHDMPYALPPQPVSDLRLRAQGQPVVAHLHAPEAVAELALPPGAESLTLELLRHQPGPGEGRLAQQQATWAFTAPRAGILRQHIRMAGRPPGQYDLLAAVRIQGHEAPVLRRRTFSWQPQNPPDPLADLDAALRQTRHILPPAHHARIAAMPSPEARREALRTFWQGRPADAHSYYARAAEAEARLGETPAQAALVRTYILYGPPAREAHLRLAGTHYRVWIYDHLHLAARFWCDPHGTWHLGALR